MSAKFVANAQAVLAYRTPAGGPLPTFTGQPSAVLRADGGAVYTDGVVITIPVGATNGSCTSTVAATGNLMATATKIASKGKPPIREGDEVTVGGIAGSNSNGSCTLSVTVFVQNAGQTKVKAG